MPREEIDRITQQALAEAAAQGVTGKAVTPFLLARIKALTGGRSLATNIALVKHNAEVGARLALALAQA
jgi:pseudouridine-5'-phosphate glycosidase